MKSRMQKICTYGSVRGKQDINYSRYDILIQYKLEREGVSSLVYSTEMIMYTYKVMIHPNNKQETKIRRTLNKCIECNNIIYDYLNSFVKNNNTFPKCSDVRKWFTSQKTLLDNETIKKRKCILNVIFIIHYFSIFHKY